MLTASDHQAFTPDVEIDRELSDLRAVGFADIVLEFIDSSGLAVLLEITGTIDAFDSIRLR